MKKLLFLLVVLTASSFAQSSHSATLNWTQSTTPGITSNTVYESLISPTGPFTVLYQSLSPMVTYTDNSPLGGKTYYYVVTASIGSSESAYSNAVTAIIPNNPFAPAGLTLSNVK